MQMNIMIRFGQYLHPHRYFTIHLSFTVQCKLYDTQFAQVMENHATRRLYLYLREVESPDPSPPWNGLGVEIDWIPINAVHWRLGQDLPPLHLSINDLHTQ